MMKFFRKYTKHLLAFFMALLLVVWLAGDPIMSWFSRRGMREDYPRGYLDGEKITQEQVSPTFLEIEVLDRCGIPWRGAWMMVLDELGVRDDRASLRDYFEALMQSDRGQIEEDDWFLLVTEAKRNGVFVPAEMVEEFKDKNRLTGPGMRNLRQQFSTKLIDSAIRSFLMVQQQAALACKATPPSEADIDDFIRQTAQKVDVTVVTLAANESSKFIDKDYKPADAELAKLFEEHKNAASQPFGLSFGYQQPEAVKIEYLKINADALAATQQIPDSVAYDYWQANKARFTHPVMTQPVPATGPAPAPKMVAYESFTEARDAVIKEIQKTKAREAALRIAREEIIADLAKPWAAPTATGTQPAVEQSAPASETALDVYAKAAAKWNARYPGAVAHVVLDMLERQAMWQNPEIGRTWGMLGGQRDLPFGMAAFLVEGLEPKPSQDRQNQLRYYRQLYETCSVPFTDRDGNAYVMRAIEIRPKQAPASLDTVRERVIADARTKHAYDLAGQQAKALHEKAAKIGIDPAFSADEELKKYVDQTALNHPAPFTRKLAIAAPGQSPDVQDNNVPEFGSDPKLLDAIFEAAAAATTPDPRVLLWEQPQQRRWLVIQVNRLLPVTQTDFDGRRAQAVAHLQKERQIDLLKEWFDPAQIKTRMKWKSPKGEEGAEKAAPPKG